MLFLGEHWSDHKLRFLTSLYRKARDHLKKYHQRLREIYRSRKHKEKRKLINEDNLINHDNEMQRDVFFISELPFNSLL